VIIRYMQQLSDEQLQSLEALRRALRKGLVSEETAQEIREAIVAGREQLICSY
jgi:hypothetical protein